MSVNFAWNQVQTAGQVYVSNGQGHEAVWANANTLPSNGNLSGGATFGQAASPTPNTLDYYAEGTWSPGITFGGANVGTAYSITDGYFTRIGRLVTCAMHMQLSNVGSSTGNANIVNLPFTSNSLTGTPFAVGCGQTAGVTANTGFNGFALSVAPNSANVQVIETASIAGAPSAFQNVIAAQFANTAEVHCEFYYYA